MFNWFRLFNLDEFLATGLVSKEIDVVLGTFGLKTILITQGVTTSITYDDTLLSIGMNDRNPFRYDQVAVFLDLNRDVWLGIYVES